MRKRHKIAISIASIVAVAGFANITLRKPAAAQEPAAVVSTNPSSAVAAVALQQDKRFLQDLDQTHPRVEVTSDNTRLPSLAAAFNRMYAMNNYFNRDKLRRDEMRELLKDKQNLVIAGRTITDLDYAQSSFAEQQALARVYAIKLLAEEARTGDPQPLLDATRSLAETLNRTYAANAPVRKAQDRDLEDLIRAAVDLSEPAVLKDDLAGQLGKFGFRQDMHAQVKKIYDDVVFFRLIGEVDRATAKALVATAFGEKEP